MARRGLSGQLHMFDFFRELENTAPLDGEVEMVSLMPAYEEPEQADQSEQENLRKQKVLREQKTPSKQESFTEQEVPSKQKSSTEQVVLEKQEVLSERGADDKQERPVMQRIYKTPQGTMELAYLNYSKIRIRRPGQGEEIKEFDTSKEAVDYYVGMMQTLEEGIGEKKND